VLERGGHELLDGGMAGIEEDRVGGTGQWRSGALLVDGIAFLDDIDFALSLTAKGADGGIRVDVKFVGRAREDDGADVAALHDEGRLRGEGLLLSDEKLPDFRNLRNERDAFVDAAFAGVRQWIDAGDVKKKFTVFEAGLDPGGVDGAHHGISIVKRDMLFLVTPRYIAPVLT